MGKREGQIRLEYQSPLGEGSSGLYPRPWASRKW